MKIVVPELTWFHEHVVYAYVQPDGEVVYVGSGSMTRAKQNYKGRRGVGASLKIVGAAQLECHAKILETMTLEQWPTHLNQNTPKLYRLEEEADWKSVGIYFDNHVGWQSNLFNVDLGYE